MSAARLNQPDLLAETLALFSEYSGNKRAQRISEFVQGFDFRLAGQFDKALLHMQRALELKGDEDVRIRLDGFAYLHLTTGNPQKAKIYITKAKAKARNNSYIAELQVLTELAFGKGYVIHNATGIQSQIDELENMDAANHGTYAYRSNVHYLLARGDVAEARAKFDVNSGNVGTTTGNRLLEAKLLTAERRFQEAFNILVGLKKRVLSSTDSQRRSNLTIDRRPLDPGGQRYLHFQRHLRIRTKQKLSAYDIAAKDERELKEQAAFSTYQLTPNERKTLES